MDGLIQQQSLCILETHEHLPAIVYDRAFLNFLRLSRKCRLLSAQD